MPTALTVVLAASLLASAAAPQSPEHAAAIDAVRGYVREECDANGLGFVAVAVADGDAPTWSLTVGGPDDLAPGRAVFRAASISKLFTAVLVMQQVEAGRLDLDRPVRELAPAFRPADHDGNKPITLRHLLSHKSGLVREPAVGHYFEPGTSLEALVESLAGRPPVYAPGERFKYSNAGVSVAGWVVQNTVARRFAEHVAERIFAPLGMRHSSFEHDPERLGLNGRMWTLDGREFPAPTFELGMAPAANLQTTVDDLVRFARCFFLDRDGGSRVVAVDTVRAMFEPQLGGPCGIGFFVGALDGRRRVGHGGAVYGFASELAILPDDGIAVAVVTDVDCANGSATRIADFALRASLAARAGDPIALPQRPRPLGREAARRLAGRYERGGFWVDLEERDGELWEIPQSGSPVVYRRAGDAIVSAGRAESRWGSRRIEPIDGGIRRNGQTLQRRDDSPPPPCPPRLRPYLGEYGWDHDVLYLYEDEGRLCCLIEWFFREALIEVPIGERGLFRMPDHGLYAGELVEFERDADGAIAAAVIGGVRFPARPSSAASGASDAASGATSGGTFKIAPRFPIERLRAMAREARMPKQPAGLREPDLVELSAVAPSLRFDLRYGTTNNFMGEVFYERPVALLQRPAAQALRRAQDALAARGYGLVIFDAYRPWEVTKMFWDATPDTQKQFVADPRNGSRHNRGCAVDLTLCELDDGAPVAMPSGYDEFTERAYPRYPGGTARQRWHRELLRRTMEVHGFSVYDWEWWHFDHADWRAFPILNRPLR